MTGLGQRTLLLQTALAQPLVGQSERRGKARHRHCPYQFIKLVSGPARQCPIGHRFPHLARSKRRIPGSRFRERDCLCWVGARGSTARNRLAAPNIDRHQFESPHPGLGVNELHGADMGRGLRRGHHPTLCLFRA